MGLGQKLKELITNGPRQVTKGLQDWNYENRLFLHKGLVYIPDNKNVSVKASMGLDSTTCTKS